MPLKFEIQVDDKGSVAINQLGKRIGKLGNQTKRFGDQFKAVFGAQLLIKALGKATQAVKSFVASFQAVAKLGDDFDKLSQRVGASVEFLSQFGYVAELAGTNISSLEPAFRRLTRNMKAADDGLRTAKDAFDELGIEVRASGGRMKSVQSVVLEATSKISNMEDQTRKLALAQEIFGRSGAEMVAILDQGTGAIQAQMQQAKELGIAWTTEGATKAAQYTDAMTRLTRTWEGLKRESILPIMEKLTPKIEELTKKVSANKKIFQDLTETIWNWVDNFWVGIQGLRFLWAANIQFFHRIFVVGILEGLNRITSGFSNMLTDLAGLLFKLQGMGGAIGEAAEKMLGPVVAAQKGAAQLAATINDKLVGAWESNNEKLDNARVRFEALRESATKTGKAIKKEVAPNIDQPIEKSLTFLEKVLLEFKNKAETIAQTIGQSIGSGIVNGFQNFDFDDFGRSFMKLGLQIAGMVLPTAIGGPFGALFGGVFSGISGGLQAGTEGARGGVYTVGEKGPETVVLPQGAKVLPNDRVDSRVDDSVQGSARGGNISVVIQGNMIGEEAFLRDRLLPALAMEVRR